LLGLAATLAAAGLTIPVLQPASAASLVQVTNFGNNPGGMLMHIYVPNTRPANPAIVVAMHGCGGSGPGFYSGSEFASLADRYGFIVIYPSAQQEAGFGKCFDTWSGAATAAATRSRSCRWSRTPAPSTAATRTGSSSRAARRAA
jgi:poly(3-hydroxybutyrate) depolymerase